MYVICYLFDKGCEARESGDSAGTSGSRSRLACISTVIKRQHPFNPSFLRVG